MQVALPPEVLARLETLQNELRMLSAKVVSLSSRQSQQSALPVPGRSRLKDFKHLLGIGTTRWYELQDAGQAPKPEKLGRNCVLYDNAEINRWLDDPKIYQAS